MSGFRITADVSELRRDISILRRAAEERTTIPILAQIRFSARDGELTLSSTDLDRWIYIEHRYRELQGAGEIAPPARSLHKLLAAVKADTVEIVQTSDTTVDFRAGKATFSLTGMPEEFFSPPFELGDFDEFEIPTNAMVEAVRGVMHCISVEQSRYQLSGAQLQIGNEEMWICSTDGHRLAGRSIPLPGIKLERSVIVPVGSMADLLALPLGGGIVRIRTGPEYGQIETSHGRLVFRLLEGTFPDWRRIIPRELTDVVKLDSTELLEVCALAKQMSVLMVSVSAEGASLMVSGINADNCRVSQSFLLLEEVAAPFRFGLNPCYLSAAVTACESQEVEIRVSNPALVDLHCSLSPIGISAPGCFDQSPQIIMPMKA